MPNTRAHLAALLLAVGASAIGTPAFAQPNNPQAGEAQSSKTQPQNAEKHASRVQQLRDRIKRRLEYLRASQTRLEEALKQLDAGNDPEEISRTLEGAFVQRPGVGDRPQPGADGAPDQPSARSPRDAHSGAFGSNPFPNAPRPLSTEDRQNTRDFLQTNAPEVLARIDAASKTHAAVAERLLDGVGSRMRYLTETQRREPEFFKLQVDEMICFLDLLKASRDVAEARKSGDAAKLEAARTSVRDRLARQFDLGLQIRAHQIEQLSERAKKMRDDLESLTSKRDQFINDKAKSLEESDEQKPKPKKNDDKPKGGA